MAESACGQLFRGLKRVSPPVCENSTLVLGWAQCLIPHPALKVSETSKHSPNSLQYLLRAPHIRERLVRGCSSMPERGIFWVQRDGSFCLTVASELSRASTCLPVLCRWRNRSTSCDPPFSWHRTGVRRRHSAPGFNLEGPRLGAHWRREEP